MFIEKKCKFINENHKTKGFTNCLTEYGFNEWDKEKEDPTYYSGCKVDVEDGVYEVNVTSTSFRRIEDIPKQKNVISVRDEKYPQFTTQHLSGKLTIKDKRVDLKELDELIPNNWWEYNSHHYLERIKVVTDYWDEKKTKYLTMYFGS